MNVTTSETGTHNALSILDSPHPVPVGANKHARKQIDSTAILYAHALAIELEAQTRYRELAAHMTDSGNDAVAELFGRLAEFEGEHASRLAKKFQHLEVPPLAPGEYAWLDSGAPVPEARAFVYRMMTPHMALAIALSAEERARAFFERVGTEARDASIRELAVEFAREEEAHIAWVSDAIARQPQPYQPSEDQPGDPAIEQQR
ncbi:MAG: ferritin family protein [Burkholderiales bacterium]|nr:ferritin family protein [Burkholderiales bacterium]